MVCVSNAERNGEVCAVHCAKVEGCGSIRVSRRTRHSSPGQSNAAYLYHVIYLHLFIALPVIHAPCNFHRSRMSMGILKRII